MNSTACDGRTFQLATPARFERFPLIDLASALGLELGVIGGHRPGEPGGGLAQLAGLLGVSYSTAQRMQRRGLTEPQADEAAIRCGLQPELVWPAFARLVDAERLQGAAAANAAKDRCVRGHEFDVVDARGWRRCSTCRRLTPPTDQDCLRMITTDTQPEGGPVESPWMTVEEAAAYARLSPVTIRRRIAAGDLPAYRHRGTVRVKRAEVDAMLEGEAA